MITALVPTFNCEQTIRECLESIKWVDRIFVVDSFSKDGTLNICREYTDWIVQHEYVNSASQKNWALDQIESEWVLQIDSDEAFEPTLSAELQQALISVDLATDAFRMRRKNLVWGKWVRSCGFYPDWQYRVFKTRRGRWSKREVHAQVVGLENIISLEHHIIHHDFTDLSDELVQFASQVVNWEAAELQKRNKQWGWIDVTMRPAAIFLVLYLYRGGYRDGFRGFFLSAYRAFYSFMIYARLYELEAPRRFPE